MIKELALSSFNSDVYNEITKAWGKRRILVELNGQFQKISIPYHGRPFGIPRARGGSLNWKSEGMGGYLRLEF